MHQNCPHKSDRYCYQDIIIITIMIMTIMTTHLGSDNTGSDVDVDLHIILSSEISLNYLPSQQNWCGSYCCLHDPRSESDGGYQLHSFIAIVSRRKRSFIIGSGPCDITGNFPSRAAESLWRSRATGRCNRGGTAGTRTRISASGMSSHI